MRKPSPTQPAKPKLAEANLGAMVGAIVGGIGGLFAIGLVPALLDFLHNRMLGRSLEVLFYTPTLSLICWLVSGPVGWVLGGQIGPRLGLRYRKRNAEIIGGVLGGLIPVLAVAFLGWYLTRR